MIEQVYIGGSIFIWGTVTVNLLGKSRRVWYPYAAIWILGALLETCVLLFNDSLKSGEIYSSLDPALQISRIVCLLILAGSGFCFSITCRLFRQSVDEENQPLLSAHGRADADYASVASDDDQDRLIMDDEDDGPNRTKELKEKQRKRLQECGSWMAYLRDFKLLAKLAWPSGNRSAKICLAILIVVILADRALNLLVPRQLGIITDKLSAVHETGTVLPHHRYWTF